MRSATRYALVLAAAVSAVASAQPSPVPACPSLVEAQNFVHGERWTGAVQNLQQVIREHAACADARYLLGYALLRANRPLESLKVYTGAAQLRPPSSDDFTAIASDYILLKAYNDAERWLLRATETAPVAPQAWYLLGRTQYNLDRNEAAVKSFQQSLAVFPEDPRSEYNLGLAYERLQQPALARTAYLTAIAWGEKKHLQDAQPYLDLGMLSRSQGKAEEALPYLEKAAALSAKNPLIFQELGRTLNELHRPEDAIAALEKAVALAPSAEPPHFFLGRAYRAAGKLAKAEEQFAIVQKLAGAQSSSATPNTDHAP